MLLIAFDSVVCCGVVWLQKFRYQPIWLPSLTDIPNADASHQPPVAPKFLPSSSRTHLCPESTVRNQTETPLQMEQVILIPHIVSGRR